MSKDIRWKQRYQNLHLSFESLNEAVLQKKYNDLERAGLIKMFELTFELSWKTLKDYLEANGIDAASPRDVIKSAFQNGYVTDGHKWLKALDDRNILSHTYEDEQAIAAVQMIKNDFFPLIKELVSFFQSQIKS
jgi:nucleotidyltransferase substrate binding protein (TIGR01987 family)